MLCNNAPLFLKGDIPTTLLKLGYIKKLSGIGKSPNFTERLAGNGILFWGI